MALEAYQAGDIAATRDELAYISQVLTQMRAAEFGNLLPPPPSGWEKSGEDQPNGMAGMGGLMTSATYSNGDSRIEVTMMAESQMVASMAATLGNAAMVGNLGEVRRVKRQVYVVDRQSNLQALIDNRILLQISGNGSVEDKELILGYLDFRALEEF